MPIRPLAWWKFAALYYLSITSLPMFQAINDDHERYAKIKDIIVNDNKRSGVQPSHPRSLAPTDPRPSTPDNRMSAEYRYESPKYKSPEQINSGRPSSRGGLPYDAMSGRSSPAGPSSSPRRAPPINPKPETLQGRAIHTSAMANGTAGDSLTERFANLRNQSRPPSSGAPVTMPSPSDYTKTPFSLVPGKPIGPRDMPPPPSAPPSRPDKIPLQMQIPIGMPKQPSPIYSPARNMQTPPSINPPRTSARSIVGTGGRSNSLQASMSAHNSGSGSDGAQSPYFPPTTLEPKPTHIKRKSVHLPDETQISAEKLYDYIRFYNILLIDVRPREEYDEGHIFAKSIMCIEPTALRGQMSAEELHESLVLSPDSEQDLFGDRDRFDLVVCYDQSTPSTLFLERHDRTPTETALKNLFDALYEFNQDKPLQRHPILLKGGLEAWTDLVGPNALITSSTAILVSNGKKSSIKRRSVVTESKYPEHRRRREFNPLDPEEERKWMEKEHHEVVQPEIRTSTDGENDSEPEEVARHYTGYEDFLRRFPEAQMLEQQSMVAPPPSRAPPPKPPSYTPPPVPTVPSRPPPAVPRPSYSGVHEHHSGPQSNMVRSTNLAEYVPQKLQPQNIRLPRTGLMNFGVTCYMNSTIQCLSGTLPLSMLFLDDYWKPLVQKENWKGSRGVMPQYYADLIRALWKGDVGAIRPTTFRRLSARLNREWGNERQQDAKEFLEFLIDFLHEDFNSQWSRPPLRALTTAEEAERERLPKPYAASVEWGRYTHRDKSLITDLFAGQHASRLRCTTCGFTSTTYEAFYSISVEIPQNGQAPVTIEDCLRSYCSEERLDGDDIWRCPRCKQEREATKQITLTRAPQYLVVHLKRFSAGHSESARKVRTPVDFPLRHLDMEPFMLPPLTAAEADSITRQHRGNGAAQQIEQIRRDPAMNRPFLYDSYAILRHLGTTISSGHYIAMVRDKARGCWRQFNDDRVSDFRPNDLSKSDRLQNEQAYILFYERVGVAKGSL
jgi:ubiquitin carboxyl-terminal hydrolase 8